MLDGAPLEDQSRRLKRMFADLNMQAEFLKQTLERDDTAVPRY